MSSPHRIHHDLYRGPKIITDPGNGKTIYVNKDLQICEMTSGASGETRTLAPPTKPGIRFVLRLYSDGGGDIVVTAAAGFNTALETSATFADAGDLLSLISVSLTASTYRWQVCGGQLGAAIASASATATASATSTGTGTPTSTSTATISRTSSASTSTSKSTSQTATATVTATGSGTKTNSPTGTVTRTATDTTTATSTQTGTPSVTGTATSTSTGTPTSTSSSSGTATATGTQ